MYVVFHILHYFSAATTKSTSLSLRLKVLSFVCLFCLFTRVAYFSHVLWNKPTSKKQKVDLPPQRYLKVVEGSLKAGCFIDWPRLALHRTTVGSSHRRVCTCEHKDFFLSSSAVQAGEAAAEEREDALQGPVRVQQGERRAASPPGPQRQQRGRG